jgi:DNA-binding NarL/FixJ family response regulator
MNNRTLSADELYPDDLTWLKQEVLMPLSERLTNREIADSLHLTEGTVKE